MPICRMLTTVHKDGLSNVVSMSKNKNIQLQTVVLVSLSASYLTLQQVTELH